MRPELVLYPRDTDLEPRLASVHDHAKARRAVAHAAVELGNAPVLEGKASPSGGERSRDERSGDVGCAASPPPPPPPVPATKSPPTCCLVPSSMAQASVARTLGAQRERGGGGRRASQLEPSALAARARGLAASGCAPSRDVVDDVAIAPALRMERRQLPLHFGPPRRASRRTLWRR